jgi:NADH-quinone oxidoreductase subunit M
MGGLWQNMPRMGAIAMFFIVASLGLPGLGNFVAEFLVLLGLFQVDRLLAVIAALGLITGAAYSLLLMQRSFQGEPDETRQLVDFGTREMLTMAVMMTALIVLGIYPQPILDISRPVVESLISFSSIVTGGSL